MTTGTVKTFGPVDRRSLEQLERCMTAGDADFGVLCADHHPGYSQPIGGGIAYEGYVSPSGVGYDIGCGNKAARSDLTRADLDALGGVEWLMHEITRRIYEVLAADGPSIRVQHTLRPLGVAMAGRDVVRTA